MRRPCWIGLWISLQRCALARILYKRSLLPLALRLTSPRILCQLLRPSRAPPGPQDTICAAQQHSAGTSSSLAYPHTSA